MKHVKLFENYDNINDNDFIDEEDINNTDNFDSESDKNVYMDIIKYLVKHGFDFHSNADDFENKFIEIMKTTGMNDEERTESIVGFLDGKWGLYDGYSSTYDYIHNLLIRN